MPLKLCFFIAYTIGTGLRWPSPESKWNGNIIEGKYRYTEDLLQWDQCANEELGHHLPRACTKILSPLNEKAAEWAQCLAVHPDTAFSSYIIAGITNGFRIGYSRTAAELRATPYNLPSAMVHPVVVQNYLDGECNAGRLSGPFKHTDLPEIHYSPFGVIPKKGGTPGD